jgi:WD40 repeat protein
MSALSGDGAAPPLLSGGDHVEHFKIVRRVSGGAMGDVYLARDGRLGRKVAIKVLTAARLASNLARERFWAEARTTAQFSHPHIVVIHAVGEHNGLPYLALEYVEGETLRERIERQPLAPGEVLRFGLAIAEALKEAHRHGVVHRDLKPENLIIPPDGRLRVLDFGVALSAATSHEGRLVCGTPPYMSPEQWLAADVTRAADVWGLGVVLYELVSGRRPFDGGGPQALKLRICDPAPAPAVPASVDPRLARLIEQCLDKQPPRRPTADQVAEQLRALLEGRRVTLDDDAGPYRGLRPFEEDDAGSFFGRDADLAAFVECLRENALVAVLGPSGAGKSSFVQAGVIPRLREAANHVVVTMRPGNDPFAALAQRLRTLETTGQGTAGTEVPQQRPGTESTAAGPHLYRDGATPTLESGDEASASETSTPTAPVTNGHDRATVLAADLRETPGRLAIELTALAEREAARVVLFVDQMEELCALVEDEEVRARFLEALVTAADDPGGVVRVVFTLRDDFLGRLMQAARAVDPLRRVFVLRPPDRETLKEVLSEPLVPFGHSFEDAALVETIVDDVARTSAPLALLQFTAELLWQRRDRTQHRLTRATYQAIGGVAGALADHGDRLLEGLTPEQVKLARELLLRLITPTGTRRSMTQGRLVEGLPPDAAVVLERLVTGRLVSSHKGDKGDPVVELAHESLITGWGQLSRWIDEGREERAALDDLRSAAELWNRRGRSTHELWQGDPLDQAVRLLGRIPDPARIPEVARTFVAAGTEQQRRRARRNKVAVTAALVFLTATSAVLWRQWRVAEANRKEARVQEAKARLENARYEMNSSPWSARAQLRSALEIADPQNGQSMWWQLQRRPLVRSEIFTRGAWDAVFSPDGRTLLVSGADASIKRFAMDGSALPPIVGQRGVVRRLAYSPDGSQLATGGSLELRVFNLRTGNSRVFAGHTAIVWGLAFSPDGAVLASTGWDKTLRLWNFKTGALLRTEPLSTVGLGVAYSPDGKLLAFADQTRIRVWDPASGKELASFGPHPSLVDIAFTPDGTRLVSVGNDRMLRLWEVSTRHLIREMRGHAGAIYRVAIDSRGRWAATASADKTLRIWDLESGRAVHLLEGHLGNIYGVAFSPDGQLVASASDDSSVRLWRPGPGSRADGAGHHADTVETVALDPTGRLVASGGYDRLVKLWDAATSESLLTLSHDGPLSAVAFFPQGDLLAAAGEDKRIRIWRTIDGIEGPTLEGHLGAVTGLVVSPDGTMLASSSIDGGVRVWTVPAGYRGTGYPTTPVWPAPRVLKEHRSRVEDVAFGPDSQTLASASADATVRLWDPHTGRTRTVLGPFRGPVMAVAFSPDGRYLAFGGDTLLSVRELATGKERSIGSEHEHRVLHLAFSPDGRQLAVTEASKGVTLWDLEKDQARVLSATEEFTRPVVYSPDGQTVAWGERQMVRLWDLARNRPRWAAPLLLKRPARVLGPYGWRRLDASEDGGPARFLRTAAPEIRLGNELDTENPTVCLQKYDGQLEHWDERAETRRFTTAAPPASRLRATVRGCLVLADGKALLYTGGGSPTALGPASAIEARQGELLVASEGRVRVLDDAGGLRREIAAKGRPTAVAFTPDGVAWAADKSIHFDPPRDVRLLRVGVGEVSDLAAGPANTLAATYWNETVVWDLRDGSNIFTAILHGATQDLAFVDGTLHIVTQLGGYRSADFSALAKSYCDTLRDIWREVPVVWENAPVPRAPPRDHPCAIR